MVRVILDPYNPFDESLSYEQIQSKSESCMTSATKYTDGHGHEAIELFCCGVVTCPKCTVSRINHMNNRFSWMNNPDYVLKVFFNVKYDTIKELNDNYKTLVEYSDHIHSHNPGLWYRLGLTNSHIVLVLKKENKDIIPGDELSYELFVKEYVDFTKITDPEIQEALLIGHKNQRRILGHGKKPESIPMACNRTPKKENSNDGVPRYSLKRAGGEIIPEREIEHSTVAEYNPIEKLVYVVDNPEGLTVPVESEISKEKTLADAVERRQKEKVKSGAILTLTFKEFLNERLKGNFCNEWEEYHGVLESTRMQKYLKHLRKIDRKTWGFLDRCLVGDET